MAADAFAGIRSYPAGDDYRSRSETDPRQVAVEECAGELRRGNLARLVGDVPDDPGHWPIAGTRVTSNGVELRVDALGRDPGLILVVVQPVDRGPFY